MAIRKRKTKEKVNTIKVGDFLEIPMTELPGTTLGKLYQYKNMEVRLVKRGDTCKIIVEKI